MAQDQAGCILVTYISHCEFLAMMWYTHIATKPTLNKRSCNGMIYKLLQSEDCKVYTGPYLHDRVCMLHAFVTQAVKRRANFCSSANG